MSEDSDPPGVALRPLLEKWRRFANEDTVIPPGFADLPLDQRDVRLWFLGRNAAYRACADELAALLAAVPRPQDEEA